MTEHDVAVWIIDSTPPTALPVLAWLGRHFDAAQPAILLLAFAIVGFAALAVGALRPRR